MTTQTRVTPPASVGAGTGRLPVAVAAGALLYGVLGTLWSFGLGGYPFGPTPPDDEEISLLSFVPGSASTALVAVLGLVGAPAALALRRTGWSHSAYRLLLGVAVAEVVLFGVAAPDVSVVIGAGYLLVLLGIPAGLVALLAGAIRQPLTRMLLVVLAAAAVVAELVTGLFDWAAFRELGEGLTTMPGKVGFRPLLVLGSAALAIGWVLLAVRGLRAARVRCVRCGRPGAVWTRPESAARWGRWATAVAVICPLPYALIRYSWLLPNPIGMTAEELRAEPGIRLFGLGLGTVALAAGLVCIGLVRPWGEIWPRWVPFLAGRPVPMRAVLVPGGGAATVLLAGSIPMTTMMLQSEGASWESVKMLLLFPFPVWGLAVGLGTLAYYYRRRARCGSCGGH